MEKSREFRKFWNCMMMDCCSSADFKAKLREEAMTIPRRESSRRMTIPCRISFMGTNSWVVFAFTAMKINYKAIIKAIISEKIVQIFSIDNDTYTIRI